MRIASLLALAGAMALPAAAQTTQSVPDVSETVLLRTDTPPPGIVVEGERRVEDEEVRDAVRDIAMYGRSMRRPMTQFHAPLCLNVVGLGKTLSATVERRIETNARDAAVEIADDGCKTNALVIVVKNPDQLIDRLREDRPTLFNAGVNRTIRAAQRRGDTAIAWSASQIADSGGKDVARSASVAGAIDTALFSNPAMDVPVTSRLGTSKNGINYSVERLFSVVIFDIEKMTGVHIDQIADYSTMRLLASPQPTVELDEDARVDTILTLFDTDPYDAPQRLTQTDRAFLRGLYAMRPNEPSNRLEKFVLAAYDEIRAEDCAERGCSR